MKKIFYGFSILAVLFLISCQDDQDEFVGSDNIITEDRNLSTFKKIDNNSIINTTISYGEALAVEVTANDNIMENVITNVSGSTLLIDLKDGNYQNVSIDVSITIPEFTEIHNEGTGNISVNNFEDLDDVTIENVGTGKINASGSADKLDIELTGTGDFNGFEFLTNSTKIKLTGTGNIEVFCSDELSGSLTGTGSIYYKGNPSLDISITGTGNVINAN